MPCIRFSSSPFIPVILLLILVVIFGSVQSSAAPFLLFRHQISVINLNVYSFIIIIIIIIIIIRIIIIVFFMQGIYTYIPETNYVPR